jgi:ATP-dependent RNA helicase DOB1
LLYGSLQLDEGDRIVFDQLHYMRARSTVFLWKKSSFFSDHIGFVFLMDTIPSAKQFAKWICLLHEQPCHVINTDYRYIPSQHLIFAGGEELDDLLSSITR